MGEFEAQALLADPGEELLFAGGSGQGLADGFAERLARGLGAAGALGLEAFGAGGEFGGGAVARVELPQAVVDLYAAGLGLYLPFVVAEPGAAAVLADEGGGDVDVVFGVADGDPAAGGGVAFGGDAGGVDDAPGDGRPVGVVEVAVAGVGADRAVPERGGRSVLSEGFDGLVELAGELGDGVVGVAAGVGGVVVPGGDQVLVGVFVVVAGAEQVADQAVRAAGTVADFRDHRRTSQATASSTPVRAVSMRCRRCRRSVAGWPPELRKWAT